MQIRLLQIRRYRGLANLEWRPQPGVNCLVGPADAGKSTILAAISLLLAPYPPGAANEFDYFERRIADGFEIEAAIFVPDVAALAGERNVALRGWLNGALTPLPNEGGAEAVLVVRVRGTPDLELIYEVLPVGADPLPFAVGLRKKMMLALLSGENRTARDLRLGYGSVLDRLLGQVEVRPALYRAVAESSRAMQLPEALTRALAALAQKFEGAGLPSDLHLGLTAAPGTPLASLVTLLHGADPATAVPLGMAGAGTRHMALMEMSSSLVGENPIIVIDEPERGLEPYRQRSIGKRLPGAAGASGQVFLTTHSPAVLGCLPAGSVWHLRPGAGPVQLAAPEVATLIAADPEFLFARMPIFCEGATEVGLLEDWLPHRLGQSPDGVGVHLIDARGQPAATQVATVFAQTGVAFAAFLDNENFNQGHRARLAAQCTLFAWRDVRNIEEAVARFLPVARLPSIPEWAAEARESEPRYFLTQLRDAIPGAQAQDVPALMAAHGEAVVRGALATTMLDKSWFKTEDGGQVLGRRLREVGIPAEIEEQIAPFFAALRQAVA